ncbi:MAG: inositol monophosphatase [Boseongicola sp. SB0673_bin_14]|nr:inositol monophosphatase [Boseongicola sp. SB0667_bin_21]MYI70104.1 inositol monophosphatase [Boseongicola sp. SB0673_bin_14]
MRRGHMPSPVTENHAAALVALVRDTARAEILPRFRSLSASEIEGKSNASDLVTVADRAAENRIAEEVSQLFPSALIVGEEAVAMNPALLDRMTDSEITVIVDPIDGTWNYANGLPLFGVMMAIAIDGKTAFGLLYDPMSDGWVMAHAGRGAFRHSAAGRTVRISSAARGDPTTGFVPLFLYPKETQRWLAPRLVAFDRIMSFRCSCHEYWLLAEGAVDFMISGLLKPWDHAAGELISREASLHAAMLDDGAPYSIFRSEGELLVARTKQSWEVLRDTFLEDNP